MTAGIPLRDYIDGRIAGLEKHMDDKFRAQESATTAALASAEKAVLKAEQLATTRAEQANEWRATIADLMTLSMPRAEYIAEHKSVVARLEALQACIDEDKGRGAGASATITWIIAGTGWLGAAVSVIVLLSQ